VEDRKSTLVQTDDDRQPFTVNNFCCLTAEIPMSFNVLDRQSCLHHLLFVRQYYEATGIGECINGCQFRVGRTDPGKYAAVFSEGFSEDG
jgi:hypothetical protein